MTFDKGDNILIEGTIEQRQFTPKGDGVQRIVHEVVVRSCHLIAPPRGTTAKGATTAASGEAAVPDLQEGATDHDGWPVG
jgi:single-strand DNA-binding protein